MTENNEKNNHIDENKNDNLSNNKKNIFIKIFDWHKRTFLHPTTKLLICVILILILFIIIFNYYKKPYFDLKAEMVQPRAYHKSIMIDNNNILITGGINSEKNEKFGTNSAEIYNIKNNISEKIENMKLPHTYHALFKMQDGNILVADINGIEIFNIKTKKFKLLKTMPTKRYLEKDNYKFALLEGHKLVILGGRKDKHTQNYGRNLMDLNIIEVIDVIEDKPIKKLNFRGNGFGLINLSDHELLIIGGKTELYNKDVLLNDIYLFNSKNFKITKWGKIDIPILNPFVFKKGNIIIVIGGEILNKYELVDNFSYVYTKGSNRISYINIKNHKVINKNIQKFLNKKDNNVILDIIPFKRNIYLLQLKSGYISNFKLIDIVKLKELKIGNRFNFNRVYRSANVTVDDGILILGGKLLYREKTEYGLYDEQKPYAQEQYKISYEGCVLKEVRKIQIK